MENVNPVPTKCYTRACGYEQCLSTSSLTSASEHKSFLWQDLLGFLISHPSPKTVIQIHFLTCQSQWQKQPNLLDLTCSQCGINLYVLLMGGLNHWWDVHDCPMTVPQLYELPGRTAMPGPEWYKPVATCKMRTLCMCSAPRIILFLPHLQRLLLNQLSFQSVSYSSSKDLLYTWFFTS